VGAASLTGALDHDGASRNDVTGDRISTGGTFLKISLAWATMVCIITCGGGRGKG
jgi:hypothetical protein